MRGRNLACNVRRPSAWLMLDVVSYNDVTVRKALRALRRLFCGQANAELTIADESAILPPRQTDSQSLDRSLVSGIAWTGGTKWATQLLSWAATLVVARILSPSDYGLMGMAAV
ncbi:MAG: hypothetical protein M3Y30_01405 [Gemmatimonadota bacterium]|nr:hypothetical protein [Gemmatimonadota bacterium]